MRAEHQEHQNTRTPGTKKYLLPENEIMKLSLTSTGKESQLCRFHHHQPPPPPPPPTPPPPPPYQGDHDEGWWLNVWAAVTEKGDRFPPAGC